MIRRAILFLKTIRAVESTLMCGFPLVGVLFAIDRLDADVIMTIARFLVPTYGLVIYVYVLNSWGGLKTDRENARLGGHPAVTGDVTPGQLLAVIYTGIAVAVFFYIRWFPQCFPIALAIAAVWTPYSHPDILAKARPFWGNVIHFTGGVLQFLLGYAVFAPIDATGVALSVFFAGVFAAGHLNHEVMDYDADKEMHLRTNAVVFGPRIMLKVAFGFFSFWVAYLALVSAAGIVPWKWSWPFLAIYPFHAIALSLFRPKPHEAYDRRYQAIYRGLFVAAGLVILITRLAQFRDIS
ncbi:UbiA family prenyltransferase [bacterium]|nr:UbiA family prenyltransferase [bacterium]